MEVELSNLLGEHQGILGQSPGTFGGQYSASLSSLYPPGVPGTGPPPQRGGLYGGPREYGVVVAPGSTEL